MSSPDAMPPSERAIRSIAIVGGGSAGWLAAAMLARALPGTRTAITVVESSEIGTIGVGEATIPPIIDLLRFLSIDEQDFVRHTRATYKLGIKFLDWKKPGTAYWHPFGAFGASIMRRPFHHVWHRLRALDESPRIEEYSACTALAEANLFRPPDEQPGTPAAGLRYALHFDATLVAQYLRQYAERLGVKRLDRIVTGAELRADGFIERIRFADGGELAADLYLDCSGFRGVLIEQALHTGYLDWRGVLPCDRAVAFPSASSTPRPPYTQARACTAGWQWRIPLQHRCGNGYVYSSAHTSDEQACAALKAAVGDPPLAEPRLLRFTAGRRRAHWNRNCVALGLASGFLEPLESTSIHLVTSGLYHLLEHFPDRHFDAANVRAYNAAIAEEWERVRDFIVLHYHLTQRDDAPLWQECREMRVGEALEERIALFKATGRIRCRSSELFTDLSWFYIFEGLGVRPERYDPLVDTVPLEQLKQITAALRAGTQAVLRSARPHDAAFASGAALA